MRAVTAAVNIPVVAIGGIDAANLLQLQGRGLAGVAVVSAIFAQADPALPAGNCTAWPGSYNFMTLQLWGVQYILSLLVRCALGAPPCTADIFT